MRSIKLTRTELATLILCVVLVFVYSQYSHNIQKSDGGEQTNKSSYSTVYPYEVVHVVDGDTLDVAQNGEKLRVRFIGINTPESVDPNRPVECFGKEASQLMKEASLSRRVRLVYDPNKPKKDDHGRELAYVIRDDGVDLGAYMIQKGAAYEYTYKKEYYEKQREYRKYEYSAKQETLGLWSKDTCSGKK